MMTVSFRSLVNAISRDRSRALTGACARQLATVLAVVTLSTLLPSIALASPVGGGAIMPWTGPLQSLLDNLSGTTARILGGLAFVVGGAIWAFTRHEEGAKRFGQAIVGIAIMIGATNVVNALAFVGALV